MIFIHLLLGILLGLSFGNLGLFILGSIFPDIDHLYIIIKKRIFAINKIIHTIKYEKKYNIKYKTPQLHSLLGLSLLSLIIYAFFGQQVIYFSFAYFLHLLIDWLDIDEKYYLYPLKIKFKGFLPIFSLVEIVATLILLLIILVFIF